MYTVYVAFHEKSGMRYVGCTKGLLSDRISQHYTMSESRRGDFQKSLHKIPREEMTWEVILHTPTKDKARECELFYIKEYRTYEKGWNRRGGVKDPELRQKLVDRMVTNNPAKTDSHWSRGKKGVFSEETLDKMRLAKLGRKKGITSDSVRTKLQASQKNRVRIECIETNQVFESLTECAKMLNLNRPDIRRVLNRERKHSHGFTFRKVE